MLVTLEYLFELGKVTTVAQLTGRVVASDERVFTVEIASGSRCIRRRFDRFFGVSWERTVPLSMPDEELFRLRRAFPVEV